MFNMWQKDKTDIKARLNHLLTSELWTDCAFMVGSDPNQKVYNAHKIVLAMSSPVFGAMFYGEAPEKEGLILITDVESGAFKVLLEYIYTDNVTTKTLAEAYAVLSAAKKFLMPALVDECVQIILPQLRPSNACKAYEIAKYFGVPAILERSQTIILRETQAVIDEPSFEDVQHSTLLFILNFKQLTSELKLFNAVHRWAVKECGRQGLPEDNASLRRVMGSAMGKIKFLRLTPQQFAEGPALTPLLTDEEALAILINMLSKGRLSRRPMPQGFSTAEKDSPDNNTSMAVRRGLGPTIGSASVTGQITFNTL